jgi:hypothetical protein
VLCFRTLSSVPFPRWAWCPPRCPQDELNAAQPPRPSEFVAILLLPLVLPAALAAGRSHSRITEGVRAGRVDTLVIFTITLAGLAHELLKERDLSAVSLADNS